MNIQDAIKKQIKFKALLLEIIRNDNVKLLESMHNNEHADIYFESNFLFCRACELGSRQCIDYLIANKVDYRTNNDYGLLISVQNGHLEVVEKLLHLKCDPNSSEGYIIELAAEYNRLEELKKLIEYGGNIFNNRALYGAAENDNVEVVKYLIELGEDIEKLTILIKESNSKVGPETTKFVKSYILHDQLDKNCKNKVKTENKVKI